MRYKSTRLNKLNSGKSALQTTLLPRIKKRSTDIYLVIVERTRLDHLSYKFYENPNYWWILASANNVKGTMYVEPGTQVRIPRDYGEVLVDHNKINSRL
tara:strand:- start:218 stop:514 length:297 start_codon:yes stop_codon:yes gene_type:complete